KLPTSSVPSAEADCVSQLGVVAVIVRGGGWGLRVVVSRTVTAPLLCVVKFRWGAGIPSALWTLRQELGDWRPSAVVSVRVASETVTEYRLQGASGLARQLALPIWIASR